MSAGHSARASRALRRLAEDDPALGALSLWVRHRDAPHAGLPAWSTADTVFYGPAFEALAPEEQAGLAAHHVLHVAFRHAARSEAMRLRHGDRHRPETYALAADAIVNETLLAAGHVLPRPFVRLAEVLGAAALAPEAGGMLADWDSERLYLRLLAAAGDGTGKRADDAGLRAYMRRKGFENDIEEGGGDAAPETDAGTWRQRVVQALEAGRRAGRGIGAGGLRLAEIPEARLPWERVLRGLVAKALTQAPRRNWGRPTGRWLAQEASGIETPFEPRLARDDRTARIVVGIDCSSSVDRAILELFAAQVTGIARRTGAETHVLLFDDGVRSRRVLPAGSSRQALSGIDLPRGGGTDFVGFMDEARALDPSAIVVLTDLEADLPPPPKAPVIWATPGGRAARPAYGTLIDLSR